MTLFLHLAARTLRAALAAFAGVLTIFLAVDLLDSAGVIGGPGWLWPAILLYANKAAVVAHEIAPGALLLGAAVATSGLRQTREWTALRALGLGPGRVAGPVLAATLAAAVALVIFHDAVGVEAAQRADEIEAVRFAHGQGYRRWLAWQQPKRWFRGGDGRRVYHLRGTLPGGGFEGVTVLELTPDFRLARRIDAGRMFGTADGGWRLEGVEERVFDAGGASRVERAPVRTFRFDEPPGSFDLRPGRPAQMRLGVLAEQVALRARLGQPTIEFALERANRLAYPLVAVPGALLAVALALRRRRRGHVATALLEAVGISLSIWAAQGICLGLGLSGRLPPLLAAWLPDLLLLGVGGWAIRRTR